MGYTKHIPQNRFKLVCGSEEDGGRFNPWRDKLAAVMELETDAKTTSVRRGK